MAERMTDDIQRVLGRMEAKLDQALSTQAEFKSDFASVHGRVTALEHDKSKIVAVAGFISVTAGILWQYLLKTFGGHQ